MKTIVVRAALALLLAGLPFTVLAATGASHPTLADFAAFDSAYIPALALTGAKRLAPSQQALERTRSAWKTLQAQAAGAYATDLRWRNDAARIDAALDSAGAHLAQARPAEAHEALESVRAILWQVRERHGTVYLMDRLTAFHDPMEEIVEATKGHSTLSEAELQRVGALYHRVRPLWRRVTELAGEAQQHGLSAEAAGGLPGLIAKENAALAALGTALQQGDVEAVLKAGPALKPPLAAAVMLYGDFRGLK